MIIIVTEHPEEGTESRHLCQGHFGWCQGSHQRLALEWCRSGAQALILVHSVPLPVGFAFPTSFEKPEPVPGLFSAVTLQRVTAQGLETEGWVCGANERGCLLICMMGLAAPRNEKVPSSVGAL